MAPQVLHRVCYGRPDPEPWQKALLTIKPALLHDYSRHKVEGCDYPAIIPVLASTDNKPSTSNAVRGTLVTGLTDGDIWRLDLFEGSQYERKKVKARLLKKVGDESGKGNVEGEEVEAETYVWTAGKDELEEGEWDFGTFKREKLWMWAGSSARGEEYAEVDEAVQALEKDPTGGRGPNGKITKELEEMGDEGEEIMESAV